MDIATIIGIFSAFGLVVVAMSSGGGLSWFLDLPSALIVFGGVFGAVFIYYPLADVFGVFKVVKHVFLKKRDGTNDAIEILVKMSKVARKEGLLALEKMAEKIDDPFFVKAAHLLVDGIEPANVANILDTELDYIEARHRLGAEIFTTMGNVAPAMGMTGTLIGLVQMLMRMSDPSTIGPAMSVALVTTFYGVILANLVFLPIAGKLRRLSNQELLEKQLIINGILSVQSGDNPRIIEQKLHSFISPQERRSLFK
ncbi:MAG: motility protein A [Syntrophales bacterium]